MKESGIILFPRWNLNSTIALDTIRHQDEGAFTSNQQEGELYFGSSFSPSLHTLAIWATELTTNNPRVVNTIEEIKSNLIIKRTLDTTTPQATQLVVHTTMFSAELQKYRKKAMMNYMPSMQIF